MYFSDLLLITMWWLLFFIIGALFLPLTTSIFSNFFDRGYIFSKIIGAIFISYFVFVLGILKILPFEKLTIFFAIAIFLIINLFLAKVRPWLRLNFKTGLKIFLFEEILFLSTLIFWSYVRSFQPDIHGLEKYMDFGFINSILRSNYFPPKDMWFTPFPINYYYFGHLVTAVLTKFSGMDSAVTYNLMLTTLFALTFTGAFSLGANLFYLILKPQITNHKQRVNSKAQNFKSSRILNLKFGIFTSGLLTAFLVTLGGNLHAIYAFFKPYLNDNPVPFWQLLFSPNTFPNSYWYPNATRFIYNTIHEFPSYSWVVADLHGHVLDIPFVLLTIAVLLSLVLKSQITNYKPQANSNAKNSKNSIFLNFRKLWFVYNLEFGIWNLLLISFLLAVMYMTNVWDGLIYALLTLTIFVYLASRSKNYTLYAIGYTLIIIGFFLFSLPFNLNFKPFASGIGVLCAPNFLTNLGKIGPFLFEANHCQRSPLWQLMILYGFFYFWAISFIMFKLKAQSTKLKTIAQNPKLFENLKLRIKNPNPSDVFVSILIIISTILIVIPEFIYIKDIYPAHYRANTMFKLVYQAFIMLSISSGYIILRIIANFKCQISNVKHWKLIIFVCIGSVGLFLVGIYPYFAINSYYGDLNTYSGLDGIPYLKKLYPSDYQAILWLNKNIKGQPVILEAQGDSYTDYARISANTGLPTVLGWTVHEWLWRGTYDIPAPRITDVQNLYETNSSSERKRLIKKYKIELVFVGSLERQKYTKLKEENFIEFAKIVYQNDQTKIYQILQNLLKTGDVSKKN